MKLSLLYELTNPKPWHEKSEYNVWHEALEQVALADKLGFHCVWAVEHHFLTELSACSVPEIFLTACAMRTERIRIGHGVVLLPNPFNYPIRVAERIAGLDIVSNGRVEFGTGRATSLLEMDGFGIDPEETRSMWSEAVEMIPRMWREEIYSHEGQHFTVPPREILPKPIQKPHPPIWMACSQPASFELAAQKGIGALCFTFEGPEELEPRMKTYRETIKTAEPVGQFVNNQIAAFTILYCEEDRQQAELIGGRGAAWYQTTFTSKIHGSWRDREAATYEHQHAQAEKIPEQVEWDLDRYAQRRMNQGGWCIGDPDKIKTQLARYEKLGFDHVLFNVQTGMIPHEKIMASMELFAKEVMPQFQS
ncbi:LLM class flavin-dependent oxidoreductase [Dehalococcoidia bacterium]|nr:LLM class flavin-dependent oxidoreductase [Dehalococcoidia bacterium]